ncbi:uncharacterized protein LOC120281011 [Dioscorea cayenensis subsp. rotundata]|uniref:Uncharacterized protein LOC120281011 n=1 Tax=Dioscorea cayennensis subsp. rotundata TaxID=55577 RepID=A0AB40CWY8_DIOCR|nr:uncharacterized protein LOC120281011 [Dioscorea cayenensis subsp. rotundata]
MATTTTTATPMPAYEEELSNGYQHGSGSIRPFFAVMSVILVVLVLSCFLGRLWAARAAGPDVRYDCLAWARRKLKHFSHGHGLIREVKVVVDGQDNKQQLPQPSPQP